MSRNDYTIITGRGRFEIIQKSDGKVLKQGEGGMVTAEKWLKEWLK